MPPALSDYDSASESEYDTKPPSPTSPAFDSVLLEKSATTRAPLQERSEQQQLSPASEVTTAIRSCSVLSKASKKRKSSSLLAGLELDNIITSVNCEEEQDASPTASLPTSLPTSFLRTRGQTNKMSFSKPVYDQKYHPMDDVLQPSRAAQHRARYEEQYCSEDSEDPEFHNDEGSDSDADFAQSYPNKRKKLSLSQTAEGTRRSSRRVNRNVLYNMSIHPQDEELDHMEVDSDQVKMSIEDDLGASEAAAGGAIAVAGRVVHHTIGKYSPGSSLARRSSTCTHQRVSTNLTEDETASEASSSLPQFSPLSSVGLGPNPSTQSQLAVDSVRMDSIHQDEYPLPNLKHTPFRIYEDNSDDELDRETALPSPSIDYADDDKENPADNSEFDDDEDQTGSINQAVEEFNESPADQEFEDFDEESLVDPTERSMFDGSSDEMDHDHHIANFQPMIQDEMDNDHRTTDPQPMTQDETSGSEHGSAIETSPPRRGLGRVALGDRTSEFVPFIAASSRGQRLGRVVLGDHTSAPIPIPLRLSQRTPVGGYALYR